MKIEIDAKRISSSPKLSNKAYKIDEDTEAIINQLKQQLIYGNNSCFLISGYRGAGKTTLVKILEEEIKKSNSKIMFIHLNFSRYEEYSLVLRKLIREIYMTFLENKNYRYIEKNNKRFIESMKLLYERTFFEINDISNRKILTELDRKLESSINIKDILEKFGPSIAVTFASINLSFNIIPNVIKHSNILLFIISLILFICQSLKLSSYFDKKKTLISELNIKSLYDDEIAEFHLKNMLKDLEIQGIKTIFVFDELDKIEKDDEMEQIVSDFKPILLSGLASFIVISGQKLYYKLTNSNLLDDSIMSSIFSKNIHVALNTNICLETLFDSYILEKQNYEIELIEKYRDSLILKSNRTVRRFINLILQDIVWENNKSYLRLEEDDIKSYKTDSEILGILTNIIDEEISYAEYDKGMKDFFSYQPFIWIKKMKLKGKIPFTKDDILDFGKDYSKIYPSWCESQLNELCNKLLKNLVNIELLEKNEEMKEEKITSYKWTKRADIKIEATDNGIDQIKSRFLEYIYEFEKYCDEIYKDLTERTNDKMPISEINILMNEYRDIKVIGPYGEIITWVELYRLSQKIRINEELSDIEMGQIKSSNACMKSIIYGLLEKYSNYVINRYLKPMGYNIKGHIGMKQARNFKIGDFDIIAENKKQNTENIVFEIKNVLTYFVIPMGMIRNIIKKLEQYNSVTKKQNKLIIFWFSKAKENAFKKFEEKVKKMIDDEYKEYKEYIYLFYVFENGENLNSKRIELYLDNVINPKLNEENDRYSEASVTLSN